MYGCKFKTFTCVLTSTGHLCGCFSHSLAQPSLSFSLPNCCCVCWYGHAESDTQNTFQLPSWLPSLSRPYQHRKTKVLTNFHSCCTACLPCSFSSDHTTLPITHFAFPRSPKALLPCLQLGCPSRFKSSLRFTTPPSVLYLWSFSLVGLQLIFKGGRNIL